MPYDAFRLETQYRRGVKPCGGKTLDHDFTETRRRPGFTRGPPRSRHIISNFGSASLSTIRQMKRPPHQLRERAVLKRVVAKLAQSESKRLSCIGAQQDLRALR